MKSIVVSTLVVFFCLVVSSSECLAQGTSNGGAGMRELRLEGCPVKLSETCFMMLDGRGTPYDISAAPAWANAKAAKSAVERNRAIRLTGTTAEGESGSCRRGIVLKEIRWTFTNRRCAASSAPVDSSPNVNQRSR